MEEDKHKQEIFDENVAHHQRVNALAEQCIREIVEAPPPTIKEKPRRPFRLSWLVGLTSVAIMGLQTPAIVTTLREKPPIRLGAYTTDLQTDACIRTLWAIARRLQEGKLPDARTVEPTSHEPYTVRRHEGETVVECPTPEIHGLGGLRISDQSPAPRLIP